MTADSSGYWSCFAHVSRSEYMPALMRVAFEDCPGEVILVVVILLTYTYLYIYKCCSLTDRSSIQGTEHLAHLCQGLP